MKKILFGLLVLIGVNAFGQNPTNYQYRVVRERLIATMVDSSFHLPRYNGTPVGLRTGSSTNDGLAAIDTVNHKLYFYSGGIWRESGFTYTANLPLRITGTVASADTSMAFAPSLTTNARLKKIVDSLAATGLSDKIYNESVVESNDSVFLRGEKIYPPSTNEYYGVDNAGNAGFHAAAVVVITNGEAKNFLNRNAAGEWVNTKYFQEMKFIVDEDPVAYPPAGDSTFADSSFGYRKLNIFRDGALQYQNDPLYGWEIDDATSEITFHPPLFTGEKVIIQIYDTLQWNSITHSVIETCVDFTTTGDLTESPACTWSSAAGTGKGFSTTSLAAGDNGYYVIQNNSASSTSNPIGLDDDGNNTETYTDWEYTIYRNAGNYWRIDNGGTPTNTGVASANGHWLRLVKVGTTVKAQYSTTSGLSWIDIYTYSVNAGHTLYAKTALVIGGSTIEEAKVYNFQ